MHIQTRNVFCQIRSIHGITIPKGVNVFVTNEAYYGGVFLTPQQAKKIGLTKYPSILIPLICSKQLLLHELGYFFHLKTDN